MRRVFRGSIALGLAAVTLGLAGCAGLQTADPQTTGTRTTEQLLATAGFQMQAADTPEKLARLQRLTPAKILRRSRDGEAYYVFADPAGCTCLYVGNEQQYQAYRALRQQKEVEDARAAAAEKARDDAMDTIFWGLWPLP